jgi:hypothetical protein
MKIIFDHLHGHVKDDRVFCEAFVISEGETDQELLELGFLPNIQPPLYWYQAKSCRINNEKVVLSYKRKKLLSQLEIEIIPYLDNKKDVDLFFEEYFEWKGFDILDYYNNNSNYPELKVMRVKLDSEVVAHTRFREFEDSILGLETSFIQTELKFSFGKDSILLLSNYGKSQGKNFVYIYESYQDYFPYKSEITGAELWEGEKWVDASIYNHDGGKF